jgi:hypothetical protein
MVPQKLGSALFASLGMDSPVPVGSFLDVFPMSVLTSSTLARLSELQPTTRFDVRRFRMNVILRTATASLKKLELTGNLRGFGAPRAPWKSSLERGEHVDLHKSIGRR